mmetsp:Transcript_62561/g.146762  ORF Transcript_62561/g.146762 Transcript_62561/m.146762 type:complete len:284 (-) Transcript_62561:1813-2664(-)
MVLKGFCLSSTGKAPSEFSCSVTNDVLVSSSGAIGKHGGEPSLGVQMPVEAEGDACCAGEPLRAPSLQALRSWATSSPVAKPVRSTVGLSVCIWRAFCLDLFLASGASAAFRCFCVHFSSRGNFQDPRSFSSLPDGGEGADRMPELRAFWILVISSVRTRSKELCRRRSSSILPSTACILLPTNSCTSASAGVGSRDAELFGVSAASLGSSCPENFTVFAAFRPRSFAGKLARVAEESGWPLIFQGVTVAPPRPFSQRCFTFLFRSRSACCSTVRTSSSLSFG